VPPLQQLPAQTGNAAGPWFTMTHHDIIIEKKLRQKERVCSLIRQPEGKKQYSPIKNLNYWLTGTFSEPRGSSILIYYLVKICLRFRQGRLAAFGLFLSNTKLMPTDFYTILIHKKYAAEGLQKFVVNVFWDVTPCGVYRSTLMTEVTSSSEISTHIHQTTRLHIQDKSNISQRSLWNFK